MAKTYSAGTIFLQVVPVFGDVQSAIRRQVKDIDKALGDDLEAAGRKAGSRASKAMSEELEKGADKAGEKAGENYAGHFETQVKRAIQSAQKEVDRLNFKTASDASLKDLDRIKNKLRELKDIDFTADFDAKRVLIQIATVEGTLKKLAAGDHEINIDANIQKAMADLAVVEKAAQAVVDRKREIVFGVDEKKVERELGAFEKKMRATAERASKNLDSEIGGSLGKIRRQLDDLSKRDVINAKGARQELAALSRDLRSIANDKTLDLRVRADAAAAYRDLLAFNAAASKLDGRELDVSVDLDAGAAAAQLGAIGVAAQGTRRSLLGLKAGGDDAANSFRSFNAIVLASVTLLPGLIPIIGTLGGALIALGPIMGAVAGGLATMLVGFSGIGDAVSALGDAQDSAAKDSLSSAKTMRNAAQSVEDAERSLARARQNAAWAAQDAARAVADAQRNAAQQMENALDQQRAAEKRLADAQRDARQAQLDLIEARQQAKQELEDLNNSVSQNKLDERQAVIDVFNATVNNDAVQSDGSASNLDREQAAIALEQAQLRLKEIREEQKRLAEEKKKADKEGVNGTDTVKTAQDALTQALEQQREAQEAVGDAAEAVNEARIEGARAVADAVRNQRRVEQSNAQAVADAQRALTRAQQGYQDAVTQTGELGSASMQKVEQAMNKLGPAGRKFAYFLFGLRDDFYDLRDAIQAAMLPPVQYAIETIIGKYGPRMKMFAVAMGDTVGDLFRKTADTLTGKTWDNFFTSMQRFGPSLLRNFGETTLNWATVFANLMTIAAPYAERLSEALLGVSEHARDWMASEEGTKFWTDFLDYAFRVGPAVVDFFESLVGAAINLGKALAPFGEFVMGALTDLLNWIAGMDPDTLGLIAVGILGIAASFQVAVGAVAAFNAGASAMSTPLSRWILFLGIAITLYAALSQKHPKLAKALLLVAGAITAVYVAWRTWQLLALIPSIARMVVFNTQMAIMIARTYASAAATKAVAVATRIWAAGQWLLNAAMSANPLGLIVIAILLVVGAILLLWKKNETFRKAVLKAWDAIKQGLKASWEWIKDVLTDFGHAMQSLWSDYIWPALSAIGRLFARIFADMKITWETVLWPVLKVIGRAVWNLYKLYFKVAFTLIKAAVKLVFIAIRGFWNKVLHPVFSAIGKVVGWLWKNVFKPTFTWIGQKFGNVFRGMKKVWDEVLAPVFKTIRETALPKLKSAFKTTVEAIQTLWGGLKKVVSAPIVFLLDTVLNKGLIAGFNKIADFVNVKGIKDIPIPKSLSNAAESHAQGGIFRRAQNYAGGGVMPGYTPGQDVHHFVSPTGGRLNLSGGEAIMRPEFTAAVGPNWIDRMNTAARAGGKHAVARMFNFAKGGIFNPLPGSSIKYALDHSYPGHDGLDLNAPNDMGKPFYAAVPGTISYVGWGRGYGQAIFERTKYGELVYGHGSRVAVHAGQKVLAGQYIGNVGSTGNSSGPHLHFGFPGGTPGAAAALLSGAAVSGYGDAKGGPGGGFPGWLVKIAKNPLSYVKGLITEPIQALKEKFTSPMVSKLARMPFELAEGAAKSVWRMMPGPVRSVVGGAGKAMSWAGNAVGDGVDAVGDALSGLGHSLGLGGRGGDDSGDYYRGGVLPYNGTMKYDAGGYLPPGLTSVVNLTGKPEPVFTSDQFDKMSTPGAGGTIHYEPHFEGSDLGPEDVAGDLNFTFRKIQRRGRYAGV